MVNPVDRTYLLNRANGDEVFVKIEEGALLYHVRDVSNNEEVGQIWLSEEEGYSNVVLINNLTHKSGEKRLIGLGRLMMAIFESKGKLQAAAQEDAKGFYERIGMKVIGVKDGLNVYESNEDTSAESSRILEEQAAKISAYKKKGG